MPSGAPGSPKRAAPSGFRSFGTINGCARASSRAIFQTLSPHILVNGCKRKGRDSEEPRLFRAHASFRGLTPEFRPRRFSGTEPRRGSSTSCPSARCKTGCPRGPLAQHYDTCMALRTSGGVLCTIRPNIRSSCGTRRPPGARGLRGLRLRRDGEARGTAGLTAVVIAVEPPRGPTRRRRYGERQGGPRGGCLVGGRRAGSTPPHTALAVVCWSGKMETEHGRKS